MGDLGIMRIVSGLGNSEIRKDPVYIAPELLESLVGDQIPELPKADVYSLGVILAELVLGSISMEKLQKIISGELRLEVGRKLNGVIKTMLSPNANKRPNMQQVLNRVNPSEKVLAKGYRKYGELLEKVLKDNIKPPTKKRRNSI